MINFNTKKNTSSIFNIVSLIFISIYFFYYFILDSINLISINGYSQIEAINLLSGQLNENIFAFTSTAEAKKNSILTWIYFAISKIIQTNDLNIIILFKSLEFLIIPFSVNFLLKSLKVENTIQKTILFLAIPIFSIIGYQNWANYGQIFLGEWYQFPHYLYFFSIGNVVRKNYINSILILFLIFLIHPAKGFAFIVATGPIILHLIYKNRNNLNLKKHYFLIIGISFISVVLSLVVVPNNNSLMENDLWIAINKIHSWHILQGTFFDFRFIMLSFFPVLILSIGIFIRLNKTDLKYLSLSLLSISIIGKLYDSYGSNPDLVKLILHRTTENIILLSILLIISQYKKLDYKFEVVEFCAFYILIYEYKLLEINYKMVLFGLLYCLLLFTYKNKNYVTICISYYLLIFQTNFFNNDIFYIVVFAFIIMIFKNEKINNYLSLEYSGYFFFLYFIFKRFNDSPEFNLFNDNFVIFYITLYMFFAVILYKINLKLSFIPSLISGLAILLIFINLYMYRFSTEKLENVFSQRTNGYYEAQIWAKNNTPINSIFFPDPQLSYAWRDFSNRNSFGTPREFVTTWTYSQNQEIFNDATKRLGVFVEDPINTMLKLDKVEYINYISEIYYSSEYSLYKELTEEWKVEYFLWSKEYKLPKFFTIIYESGSHYILILN